MKRFCVLVFCVGLFLIQNSFAGVIPLPRTTDPEKIQTYLCLIFKDFIQSGRHKEYAEFFKISGPITTEDKETTWIVTLKDKAELNSVTCFIRIKGSVTSYQAHISLDETTRHQAIIGESIHSILFEIFNQGRKKYPDVFEIRGDETVPLRITLQDKRRNALVIERNGEAFHLSDRLNPSLLQPIVLELEDSGKPVKILKLPVETVKLQDVIQKLNTEAQSMFESTPRSIEPLDIHSRHSLRTLCGQIAIAYARRWREMGGASSREMAVSEAMHTFTSIAYMAKWRTELIEFVLRDNGVMASLSPRILNELSAEMICTNLEVRLRSMFARSVR